jgi:hypothetical protein
MIEMIKTKWFIGICIAIVAAIVGLISVQFFGNDNPIEEASEKVIQDETGIIVDLSPTETTQTTK